MINKVILMGRLTADPVMKQTPQGVSVVSFTVAVDRGFKPKDGSEKQADFISVVAWRQTAEFVARYFSKGKMIIVEGSLRTRNYNDTRYPEVKHYVTEVYADNVTFGESKSASSGGDSYSVQNNNSGFQQPSYSTPQNAQQYQPQQESSSVEVGSLSDFEEILSDGDVPF